MRILPLAFVPHTVAEVFNVSALTHAHAISKTACAIYVVMVEAVMNGVSKESAFEAACKAVPRTGPEFLELDSIVKKRRDEIRSGGYVVDTLEAAFWCFMKTDSYRDCVLTAVNLEEDTDTVAAVCGGLAGLYYGIGKENGIPQEWISQIPCLDWIKGVCGSLEKVLSINEFWAETTETAKLGEILFWDGPANGERNRPSL